MCCVLGVAVGEQRAFCDDRTAPGTLTRPLDGSGVHGSFGRGSAVRAWLCAEGLWCSPPVGRVLFCRVASAGRAACLYGVHVVRVYHVRASRARDTYPPRRRRLDGDRHSESKPRVLVCRLRRRPRPAPVRWGGLGDARRAAGVAVTGHVTTDRLPPQGAPGRGMAPHPSRVARGARSAFI